MFKVLVVEDDKNIRKLIASFLTAKGFVVSEGLDGEKGLEQFEEKFFDIVITDLMMPNMDGVKMVEQIRKVNKEIPVIMLTAKDAFGDKKQGFESGADDYIVKPVEMEELLLRVTALLRRSKIASEKKLMIGSVVVNFQTNTVTGDDIELELPKKEFQLLFKLLSSPNQIFTRLQLMDEIWGFDTRSDDRTVDVHIKRLREKLACVSDFELVTVRGLGYKAVVK